MYDTRYEDMRPYFDEEVPAAFQEVLKTPGLDQILSAFYPAEKLGEIRALMGSLETIHAFQGAIISDFIQYIVDSSTKGFAHSGLKQLDADSRYIYLSNHRDIVVDSGLVAWVLFHAHGDTPAHAIGDNLVQHPLAWHLTRLNKSFIVKRNLPPREALVHSKVLSNFIQYMLHERHESIWLAHRNGRAKNGDDQTDTSILKMLTLAEAEDFEQQLLQLHLVPTALSYQYEPCALEKVREVYHKKVHGSYEKQAGEDMRSILQGIQGQKGKVHLAFGKPLAKADIQNVLAETSRKARYKALAHWVDVQIQRLYHCFDTNYIAADLLADDSTYAAQYTDAAVQEFQAHIQQLVDNIEGENAEIERLALEMYARPVWNQAKHLA